MYNLFRVKQNKGKRKDKRKAGKKKNYWEGIG